MWETPREKYNNPTIQQNASGEIQQSNNPTIQQFDTAFQIFKVIRGDLYKGVFPYEYYPFAHRVTMWRCFLLPFSKLFNEFPAFYVVFQTFFSAILLYSGTYGNCSLFFICFFTSVCLWNSLCKLGILQLQTDFKRQIYSSILDVELCCCIICIYGNDKNVMFCFILVQWIKIVTPFETFFLRVFFREC